MSTTTNPTPKPRRRPRERATEALAVCPADDTTDHAPERTGILVTLEGEPRPLPRPRFYRGRAVAVTNAATKHYKAAVEAAAKLAVEAHGGKARVAGLFKGEPLLVRLAFSFPTKEEERWGEPHAFKPDTDNLVKLVLDAFKSAGLFGGDDCQVSHVQAHKEWDMAGHLWALVIPARQVIPTKPLDRRSLRDLWLS